MAATRESLIKGKPEVETVTRKNAKNDKSTSELA